MASVKVKFRPSSVNGKEGSIYYQVIHNRVVRQIRTDYRIFESEWDDKASTMIVPELTGTGRKNHLQSVISDIEWDIKRLKTIIALYERGNKSYTSDDIILKFNRQADEQSLFSFMQGVIEQLKRLNRIRTSETYTVTLASFMKFRDGQDILLCEIDGDIMMLYEAWLKANGNCPNTISFYMRILRAVYNRAVEKELIEQKYPFKHVYTGIDKTVKRAIPLKTIKRIKELDLTMKPHLDYARDMFLFSFYTRGMSFVDMAYLKKSDLKNGILTYRRRKTGQQLTVKWEKCMGDIVAKYEGHSDTQYLLPIITDLRANERIQYRNALCRVNIALKEIARLVGLALPLSMYCAGHSMAGREKGIRRLMSINLLKRLESSVNSFRLTLQRIQSLITSTVQKLDNIRQGEVFDIEVDDVAGNLDYDDRESDMFIGGKKTRIALEDIDHITWRKYLEEDLENLNLLLLMLEDITPEHDSKLQQLIADLRYKFAHPINGDNRKVIIFTAFSDTAEYLYDCLAPHIKEGHGLNTALVTGDVEARSTLRLPQREKLDFNKVLTLFSPVSKDRDTIYPHIHDEIDVLIATDCISEGQNLQDCDYLINYDIHWNPVRIIQRFGRIDRIGSRNAVIQLVNYWPNVTLDDYINLKGRVEVRMKVSVLTSTGDDNPISPEEKGDLEYRREQLKRLQNEVVDIEEMNTGISIMDLGLNEFRLDLLAYMKENPDIEHTPFGLHAIVPVTESNPAGVIFVLKNRNNGVNIDRKNRLHPFYMVYILEDKKVVVNHLSPKELLDRFRFLCKGKSNPDMEICREFNRITRDGKDMKQYSGLLNDAIASIISVKQASDIDSFLSGVQGSLFTDEISGLDDFELICFLVIK